MSRIHDPKTGRITHAAAVEAIKAGGSVSFGGNIYNSLSNLPSEAVFAKGDPTAIQRAQQNINDRKAQLEREQAELDASGSAPVTSTSPPETGAASANSDGLDEMNMKDLKAMADEEGVLYVGNINKRDLAAAIRTKRAESKEPPPADTEE